MTSVNLEEGGDDQVFMVSEPRRKKAGKSCCCGFLCCLVAPLKKLWETIGCWIIALLIIAGLVVWLAVDTSLIWKWGASMKTQAENVAGAWWPASSDSTRLWRRTLPGAAAADSAWAAAAAVATTPTIASGWIEIRSSSVTVDVTLDGGATTRNTRLKLVARPRDYPASPVANLTTWDSADWSAAQSDGGAALQHWLAGDDLFLVLLSRKDDHLLTSVRVPAN